MSNVHLLFNVDNCYVGVGTGYRGNVSITINNFKCRPWYNMESKYITTSDRYPELILNYCRNPGGLLNHPWCYVNTSTYNWDYCNISVCTADVVSPDGVVELIIANPAESQSNLMGLFSVLFILVLVLIVIILCAVFVMRRCTDRTKQNVFIQESSIVTVPNINENSNCEMSYEDIQFPCMLKANQIKYISQIGQGNFGVVFKGRAVNIKNNEKEIDVAVKQFKETSQESIKDFIEEAKLMFSFDHPNILTIYGVCMEEMPYQIVFEYMDEGDLAHFLRKKSPLFCLQTNSNDTPSLSKSQLLHICVQVVNGMKYLSSNHHIHRDLACRNCLIKSDLTVKIGDFGLSRNLYKKDYYRIQSQNAQLPVRWLAPESLIYGRFSIESDVWCFGVLMWEIFSFALRPYYALTNEQVIEAIRTGKVLEIPIDCPMEIYEIMKCCWSMDILDRPSFDELYDKLNDIYENVSTQSITLSHHDSNSFDDSQ